MHDPDPDPVPFLCERCWYPVWPGQPARRWHPHTGVGPFAPLWVAHEHREDCPPAG